MPIITFWSKTKKETAQTLSMIAIATYMAVENNSRILIIDTNFSDKTIQNSYFVDKSTSTKKVIKELSGGKIDIGTGIEGLAKLITSGKSSGDSITDYARVILKGRLEAILSYDPRTEEDKNRIVSVYKDLIKLANQQYDYVFVDAQKGLETPFINEILDISHVIVYNITQRLRDMDEYIELKSTNPIFKTEKVLPLIGRYDRFSKYTKKNIARYLGEKKEIPAVSYNTLFFESANEGGIGQYFLKFRKSLISSQDRNAVFVDEVANATERLILKTQEMLMIMR